LGLMDRVDARFAETPPPTAADITTAFWCACHGGQREAAGYLLERGAELNWIGYDGLSPLDAARRSHADAVVAWLKDLGGTSASSGRA
jgi:ankyrin repeat protein